MTGYLSSALALCVTVKAISAYAEIYVAKYYKFHFFSRIHFFVYDYVCVFMFIFYICAGYIYIANLYLVPIK